ncbi:hypothetical protein PGTUg99_000481 [Puccinia graminis f. sp. tritici]|uniref:Uncharacterized protein n=1 Tax=Puccinia graminis f. sp. tritici TaxID=56615 RepID=A0A5B0R4Z2_PUCGR|nr:hypothetical protein PGTUg99_017958 [Puccinia graminis f. sp. tritici]KAA1120469.1 hypothetical protein PGTUg99_000481 [Puccinia graminis f. sp. tritici]
MREPPNWVQLKEHLDSKYYIHASDGGKRFMWIVVGIYPIVAGLHIAGALKRIQRSGFWFARLDSEGYINENRHVVVHFLSAFKTIVALIALVFMQHDIRSHIHAYCVIMQAMGIVVMYINNWHRTWTSIYSMPPTSLYLKLNQRRGKHVFNQSDRAFPPWLFNLGLVGGSLYGILLTIPTVIIMCISINRANSLYVILSNLLDDNIALAQDPTPESKILMMQNAAAVLSGVERLTYESMRIYRAFEIQLTGLVVGALISLALYWWSLHAIMRCLNAQLTTFRRCLQNRDDAIQLGMISRCQGATLLNRTNEDLPEVKTKELDHKQAPLSGGASQVSRASGYNWKSWFPSLKSDNIVVDHALWKSNFMRPIKAEGMSYKARLRAEFSVLQRCKTNLVWQAVFISMLCFSYAAMAITLGK